MESNSALKHRIDTAFFQIIELDPSQREDMRRLWRPARALWDELDKELVECRRLHKPTIRYKELEQDLQDRLDLIEQYITFGLLTK